MIAIHTASDIHKKQKELESKWKRFILDNHEPDQLRNHVYQSWKRCQSYGINPQQKKTSIALTSDQLMEWIKNSQLYQISLPILQHLTDTIQGTGHLITFCDNKGKIIYLQGDRETLRKGEQMNFVPGADWGEEAAGTNAIGTCINIQQPIQIFSFEHFCEGCHPWVCSSAPIHDPFTKQLLGVVDLTAPYDLAQPHTLGIAMLTAKTIELRFQETSEKIRAHLKQYFTEATTKWKTEKIMVIDAAFRIVEATSSALALFRAENRKDFWLLPGLEDLKSSLLNDTISEREVYLPFYKLKVSIKNLIIESERVGFLLHLQQMNQQCTPTPGPSNHWFGIIGESKALKTIISKCQMIAQTNVPVLLTGESGTGKERFAQAIHQSSLRHNQPFLAINCGAIPKELMASELFGYEPGTFTGGSPKGKKGKFEEANNGTLFLDEIGEMPLDLQVFLLRVLQEKEVLRLGASKPVTVDVRIIAATNQNMELLIKEGKFRADLYYRLNVVELLLPPLRERGNDIQLLSDQFMKRFAQKYGKTVQGFDEEVLSYFHEYHWPGNLRELENVIEHAVLFADTDRIKMSNLPHTLPLNRNNKQQSLLEQEEKKLLIQLLQETNGNLSEVARRAKIARTTLYRKMEKYNLYKSGDRL